MIYTMRCRKATLVSARPTGNLHDMVQNVESRRGRPPGFDRDAVIRAAIGAFFETGYEATTLADLERSTGIDRSTLYNSFGGKRGLYELATQSYLEDAEAGLFGPLERSGTGGYDAVLEFLGRLRTGLTSDNAIPGCLIVNDMAAGTAPEQAARYRVRLEEGLESALERAGDPDADARAGLLASSVLGVNLVSKATGDRREVARLLDAVIATVTQWRDAS